MQVYDRIWIPNIRYYIILYYMANMNNNNIINDNNIHLIGNTLKLHNTKRKMWCLYQI